MAQHDMNLADAAGIAFRADLNNALAALVGQNSGATEPTTTYAYMWWADTTSGWLKQRNAADNAWINKLKLADATTTIGAALLSAATAAAAQQAMDVEVGVDVLAHVAPGTAGNVLTSNGSAWTSAAPASASTDQVARDQIALTNMRLMLNSAVTTGALVQGKQWELSTDEWGAASTNETYNSGAIAYYSNLGTSAFSYTGADQTFNVPSTVSSVMVELWGAGAPGDNYSSTANGAAGGYTAGKLAVTPSEALTMIVGQAGVWSSASTTYGGGGKGVATYSASGGGRSAIRRSSTELATAGGAGGGANTDAVNPAAGGGTTGVDAGAGAGHGKGGTQSAGGAAGTGATAGSAFTGGDGHTSGGGGGGGGYYGGGGGGNPYPGGGGSGYIGGLTSASTTAGSGAVPPGTTSPNYSAGIGVGGTPLTAGNGRVVVSYGIDMTLIGSTSVSAAPAFVDCYFLYLDEDGGSVLGTDLTVELSRDNGTTYATATITNLGSFDGTYSMIKARADVSAQPSGTTLKTRIKALNGKIQRVAAPALYAE